jgi:hypothetical protein
MKAGNCDQFALIEADQRCIDHVFNRLPRERVRSGR